MTSAKDISDDLLNLYGLITVNPKNELAYRSAIKIIAQLPNGSGKETLLKKFNSAYHPPCSLESITAEIIKKQRKKDPEYGMREKEEKEYHNPIQGINHFPPANIEDEQIKSMRRWKMRRSSYNKASSATT